MLVPHFDGWGTSLCWWANVVGGYSNREEYADLAFKQLGLNIVRYNIGGGENPARTNTMEFRARLPGFQPEPGKWDWNADANQRWMLRAAVARGSTVVSYLGAGGSRPAATQLDHRRKIHGGGARSIRHHLRHPRRGVRKITADHWPNLDFSAGLVNLTS